MAFKVGSTKSGPKSVPTPGRNASFVIGSRPPSLRSPSMQRVKPMAASTRGYGKAPNMPPFGQAPPISSTGIGFGDTGNTGES